MRAKPRWASTVRRYSMVCRRGAEIDEAVIIKWRRSTACQLSRETKGIVGGLEDYFMA